jgi:long-chain acyl-CoA synthetase
MARHKGQGMTERVAAWPNLVAMFFAEAERGGNAPFLWRKGPEGWQPVSWAEAAQQVASLATALRALGIEPGDRVAIVSENRPEFCVADLGIMAAGAISVPTYTTNTERDHVHILTNSGARAVIVSTNRLARTLLKAVYQAQNCAHVIGMEPLKVGQSGERVDLHHWDALLRANPGDVAAVRAGATMNRQDTACLIYTSGTGGTPRGVRQHHGAILHNVAGCVDVIEHDFPESGRERFLSFLPLSHAYEHTAGQFLPIGLGGEIFYSEGLDKLAANIEEVKPTIMVVVPRLFEVLRARMVKTIQKQGGLAPRLLETAEALSRRTVERGGRTRLIDRPVDFLLDRTLRNKVRARFGGRVKAMVSGGAPLNPDVGVFFHALGLRILQGYGQTESAPVFSCNRPAAIVKMHSVGPPLRNTEVRIAEDGEILVRGELVMEGYWDNPAETARVLHDGWLHTGDIGEIDADGHIVITDRKKDIIVNDKGENIAPQKIEGMLTLQPEIAQAMVSGDKRPYLVGVVVPDAEFRMEWAAKTGLDIHEADRHPEFVRAVQAAVDRVNQDLTATEKVRRVILADAPFTVENEQLTPSMKIRRHVLKQVYAPRLDALYR